MGLKVGDRVNLVISLAQGAVNTLDFQFTGVFQSFSKDFDARAVRISLPAARELMDTQGAHILVVTLWHTEDTSRLAESLRDLLGSADYDIAQWNKLSDFYEKTVDLYDRQFGVLRVIILLMVLLSVANSVNMTIFERTREFGTVIALGTRPAAVFRTVLAESAIIGFLGAVLGMSAGCLLAWLITVVGIPMPPPPNANLGYTAGIPLAPECTGCRHHWFSGHLSGGNPARAAGISPRCCRSFTARHLTLIDFNQANIWRFGHSVANWQGKHSATSLWIRLVLRYSYSSLLIVVLGSISGRGSCSNVL